MSDYCSLGLKDPRFHHVSPFDCKILVFSLIALLLTANAHSAQLNLAWDPNTEPELAGYKLYYGQSSGRYDSTVDVGNQIAYTLSGLEEGRTYYVAVTAYDADHSESAFSNELSISISYLAPTAAFSASPTSGKAPLVVTFADASIGSISSRLWNFGDGGYLGNDGSSSSPNVSHSYASAGTYSVSLTVSGPGGSNTRTQLNYITVTGKPNGGGRRK